MSESHFGFSHFYLHFHLSELSCLHFDKLCSMCSKFIWLSWELFFMFVYLFRLRRGLWKEFCNCWYNGKMDKWIKKEATWLSRVAQYVKVPTANPDCLSLIKIIVCTRPPPHTQEVTRRQGIKIPSQQIQRAGKIPNHQKQFLVFLA